MAERSAPVVARDGAEHVAGFLVRDRFLDVRHRGHAQWTSSPAGRRLVHHCDAGSQYTSVAFTAELLQAGLAGSIGTVGDALDNALCESTIGLFKTEAINDGGPTWASRRDVEWQVARWVHWYNCAAALLDRAPATR